MTQKTTFSICCDPVEINDATFRYVDIIRRGLTRAGLTDLGLTRDKALLKKSTLIVTISCRSAVWAIFCNPKARLFHWFQGLEAIERRYLHGGFGGRARYLAWDAMEQMVLSRASYTCFVSTEMLDFFKGRDPRLKNTMVMPCYNADFGGDSWPVSMSRYKRLDLVYAGSLYPWQCVAQSLAAFERLQKQRADASLTIFTREIDRAEALLREFEIFNVRVESLSPEQLMRALREFSFGFLLREEMLINKVSTPTKFSSYLAAGVIPITTNATPALNTLSHGTPYRIVVEKPDDSQVIADSIIKMSELVDDGERVRESYRSIFERYFSDSHYEAQIAEMVGQDL